MITPLKALLYVLVILVGGYSYLRIAAFVHLFADHAGHPLTQAEVAHNYDDQASGLNQPTVPRILHQIFHNWSEPSSETLPSDWNETRQTCIDLNHGWEHWLWTVERSRDFLVKEYPWFLSTYDNFRYPVQRIDSLRYFLIRHFGGIYIDLDNGCLTSLEPLRYYPAWVVDGGRGALSNNVIGGEPGHPYWIMMSDSIISYAWNYPFPYITISYATGQWYETEIWEKYHSNLLQDQPSLTRVMMDGRLGASPWVFFTHTRGGTWDNWDNHLFHWIGDHVILTVTLGLAAFACVCRVIVRGTRQVAHCWRKSREIQYASLPTQNRGDCSRGS